jgi:S1-C subfamily serine protease
VEKPWLGAKLETVTREYAEGLGLDRVAGAVVTRLSDGGPAATAGLAAGDVIVKVDGFEVTDARSVAYRLATRGVGHEAHVEVIRKGKPVMVTLALQAAPNPGRDDVTVLVGNHPFDGARVANIGAGVADDLNLDETEGVVVLGVKEGSVAAWLGFQTGDVIIQVGQARIKQLRDLDMALKGGRQRLWQVAVKRGERILQLQVPG